MWGPPWPSWWASLTPLPPAATRLIAMPEYRRRAAAAAEPACVLRGRAAFIANPAAAPGGLETDDNCSPIDLIICSYEPPDCPALYAQNLRLQWLKVLQRLHKAAESLGPSTQPISPANAASLSVWICEGPKGKNAGIDSKLDAILPHTHTMILWAAAVCRICTENIFTRGASGDSQPAAELVRDAAGLAAALLDVTRMMGRLSAAGISFNTQPSPAAVAAAIDLAAQVTTALSPYQYEHVRREKQGYEQHLQQLQPDAQPPLPLRPLYLNPLQMLQQQESEQSLVRLRRLGEVDPQGVVPLQAHQALKESQEFWSLGAPVMCFHGARLLQQWEQQLQQQGVVPSRPTAAAAAAPIGCSDGSSSTSRPAWQEAEGLLLLGAAALENSSFPQQQHQLALCNHYQKQFQQAASTLGLSSGLMAAVAACFSGAEQYSSGGDGGGGSSSEGAAAGSDATADCLSTVCSASLLLTNVFATINPATRSQAEAAMPPVEAAMSKLRQLTAAEEVHVAEFFLMAPGLLSATAGAAYLMAVEQVTTAETPAAIAAAVADTVAVLSQLPLLAHLLQLSQKTWPSFSRLLCGELTAAEQASMAGTGEVWKQHQKHQQQLQQQREKDGRLKECAHSVCVAAGLGLLGNSSILLQQLMKFAATAAAGNRPQKQQLAAAVLYCADAVGDQVGAVWADLCSTGCIADSVGRWEKQSRVIAQAVQAFEAAVRYLFWEVPDRAPLASSISSTSSTSSSGSGSSGRRVPPSVFQVELAAVRIYSAALEQSSKGGSSKSTPITELDRTQHELLQAVLSMLLTSAKLWQAGLQPAFLVGLLSKIVTPVSVCIKLAEATPAAATPGAPPAAAATAATTASAAAMAAAEAAGGVQVCQLVTRYLSCLEQQLRGWAASEDAKPAYDWLTGTANQDITPLPLGGNGSGRGQAAGIGPRRLQAVALIVQASSVIARASSGGGDTSDGSSVAREGDRVNMCYRSTLAHLVKLLQFEGTRHNVQKGTNVSQQLAQSFKELDGLQSVLLGSLGPLADALQGFGSALAAVLPSRFGCNWPGCVRLSGVSEGYGLVRGQVCVCGGCRQARYCSVACQAAHWPAHKAFCQHLQQRQQQEAGVAPGVLTAGAAGT